jgi:hypothetical protein
MKWIYDDGGRHAAGFRAPLRGGCVARAIAIATGYRYLDVHAHLDALSSAYRVAEYRRKSGRGRASRTGA